MTMAVTDHGLHRGELSRTQGVWPLAKEYQLRLAQSTAEYGTRLLHISSMVTLLPCAPVALITRTLLDLVRSLPSSGGGGGRGRSAPILSR